MKGIKKQFISDLNSKSGETEIYGWVHQKRDVGKLVFLVLRDRTGLIQVIFKDLDESIMQILNKVSLEDVVRVQGNIQKKISNDESEDLELKATSIEIISQGNNPVVLPVHIDDTTEKTRLKYRYMDLRTLKKQEMLQLRHDVIIETMNFLGRKKFLNVSTPLLSKATPEGSRDFLVPSREYEGKHYALPQSPQLYKQILMSSGVERYFQIAPSFRDEDARADRHQEFYEIDIEASYFNAIDVRLLVTRLLRTIFKKHVENAEVSFKRLSYSKAMNTYGSDKPDLRFEMLIKPLGLQLASYMSDQLVDEGHKELAKSYSNYLLEELKDSNLEITGEPVMESLNKNAKSLFIETPLFHQNKEKYLEEILSKAELLLKQHGLRTTISLISFDNEEERVTHSTYEFDYNMLITKGKSWRFWNWKESQMSVKGKEGFILVINKPKRAKDSWKVLSILGLFRAQWGRRYLIPNENGKRIFKFVWITNWPLFEKEKGTSNITSSHHPFTKPDDKKLTRPLTVRNALRTKSTSYDIVCNGYELGSGSERLVDKELQKEIFEVLKINHKEMREKFGFFMDAMNSGTPPHAGIGLGLERILMVMLGLHNIRDVIPFPKTADGFDLMSNSPSLA